MELTSLFDWKNSITASVIAGIILLVMQIFWQLPTRLIRHWRNRKTPTRPDFPFEQLKPEGFGKWLAEDALRLTCCENPFVPKEEEAIYESDHPEADRRRIYLGEAETGKTRAAYEWVREILGDNTNAEILVPTGAAFPNPIEEGCIPTLKETVVLFYDDLHTSLLGLGKAHQEGEGRMLSPEDRFEKLIDAIRKRCTHLYVVCTARQEPAEAVQPIESYSGVWKTFNILTLKDAPQKEEMEMIQKFAEHHEVKLSDEMVQRMTETNSGHSYENTAEFLKRRKESALSHQDIEEYKEGTSARWEREVFHELQLRDKHKLLPRLIGTMYTLRFELGLPLFLNFVLVAARVNTTGRVRERRLIKALELLCKRGGFRNEKCMILCHDFQLEIPGRVSQDAQDCLDRLYRARRSLSHPECSALADGYFHRGLELYQRGDVEAAAAEWEKCVSLKRDYHEAYYNWGVALSDLARLRQDEGLFQKSIEKYQRAVEIKPDHHQAYNNWGNALSALANLRQDEGLFQESIRKYQRAVEIKTDKHEAYCNWGNALSALANLRQDEGLFQESIEKYQRAVEIKPDDHQAYYNWGNSLYELARLRQNEGLFQESFEKYQRTVGIKPDDHRAYNNWGLALYGLARLRQDEGLFQESIEKYQRAVEIKPDDHQAYYNWGNALSDLAGLHQDEGLFQESFEKYQRAVEIRQDDHQAYYNWGIALYELAGLRQDEELFQESFQKYQRAVEIKPDKHEAYCGWGVTLLALAGLRQDEGLFEQGAEKFMKALEIKPDDWEYHFNLACSYALRGLVAEACDSLDSAFSLSPKVVNNVRTDADFDPIRDDPVFQQWLREHGGDSDG